VTTVYSATGHGRARASPLLWASPKRPLSESAQFICLTLNSVNFIVTSSPLHDLRLTTATLARPRAFRSLIY